MGTPILVQWEVCDVAVCDTILYNYNIVIMLRPEETLLTRRELLKLAAMTAAGAAMVSCGVEPKPMPTPIEPNARPITQEMLKNIGQYPISEQLHAQVGRAGRNFAYTSNSG